MLNFADWINLLVLGGLCGALGQGARVVVGFKKLNDTASIQGIPLRDLIEGMRLLVSFGIGFVVGALAITQIIGTAHTASLQQILEVAAAGYAGSDFLEGFISRAFGDAGGGQTGTPDPAPQATQSAIDAQGYAG